MELAGPQRAIFPRAGGGDNTVATQGAPAVSVERVEVALAVSQSTRSNTRATRSRAAAGGGQG